MGILPKNLIRDLYRTDRKGNRMSNKPEASCPKIVKRRIFTFSARDIAKYRGHAHYNKICQNAEFQMNLIPPLNAKLLSPKPPPPPCPFSQLSSSSEEEEEESSVKTPLKFLKLEEFDNDCKVCRIF